MRSLGLAHSDWSGSGGACSGLRSWLRGDAPGPGPGLGLRRGEREWLRFRSRLAGERLRGDGDLDFLLCPKDAEAIFKERQQQQNTQEHLCFL